MTPPGDEPEPLWVHLELLMLLTALLGACGYFLGHILWLLSQVLGG